MLASNLDTWCHATDSDVVRTITIRHSLNLKYTSTFRYLVKLAVYGL